MQVVFFFFFFGEGGQWDSLGPSWLTLTWFCALGKSAPFPSPGFLGCLTGVTVFSIQAQVIVQVKISAQGKQASDKTVLEAALPMKRALTEQLCPGERPLEAPKTCNCPGRGLSCGHQWAASQRAWWPSRAPDPESHCVGPAPSSWAFCGHSNQLGHLGAQRMSCKAG